MALSKSELRQINRLTRRIARNKRRIERDRDELYFIQMVSEFADATVTLVAALKERTAELAKTRIEINELEAAFNLAVEVEK